MKKTLKIIISLLVILVLLLIIGGVLIAAFVNPNDFKGQISAYVYDKTGRDLKIDGDIKHSFFPWLGVRVQNVRLSNAVGFQPQDTFVNVGEMDVNIKVLPLLSRRIEVDKLVLKNVNLYLSKNRQGKTNWEDLTAKTKKEASANSAANLPEPNKESSALKYQPLEINIVGVEVRNANVFWVNDQKNQHLQLKNIEFTSKNIGFNKSFPLKAQFLLESDRPSLKGKFSIVTTALLNPQQKIYQFDKMQLTSSLEGRSEEIKLQADQIAADLNKQTLHMTNLRLSGNHLNAKGDLQAEQILHKPVFKGFIRVAEFNLKEFLSLIGKSFNTQDPMALQRVSVNADFEGSANSLKLHALSAKVDDSSIQGNINITNWSMPAFIFEFTIDQFNLDRYLPNGDKNLPVRAHPVTTNEVTKADTTVSTYPNVAQIDRWVEFRQANIAGSWRIGMLTVAKVIFSHVDGQLLMKDGMLAVAPLTADVYQGRTKTELTVDLRHPIPHYTAHETLQNIQINQLLKSDRLTGAADVTAHVTMQGMNKAAILASLNGDTQFSIKNGALLGINLPYEIARAMALLKKQLPPPTPSRNATDFGQFTGTGLIKNGVFTNNDLLVQSTDFKIEGNGTANFVTQQLNYKLLATGLHIVTNSQGQNVQEERQTPIPLLLRGTFNKPLITPDIELIAKSVLRDQIHEKLNDNMSNIREKAAGLLLQHLRR